MNETIFIKGNNLKIFITFIIKLCKVILKRFRKIENFGISVLIKGK